MPPQMNAPPQLTNFGRNVSFTPKQLHEPKTEDELLQLLSSVHGQRIRVVGSLHAWSDVAAGNQVVISLQHLNAVRLEKRDGELFAVVGGGCKLKHLLKELRRQGNVTLPSIGLITEQTIAGATATGTHGSGKHSLSHYLAEVRIATYNAEGTPCIKTINRGVELLAARCSLGCLGVIVSVSLKCRPTYQVAEYWRWHNRLSSVLEAESHEPLQQFFLIPWKWKFAAQHRREVDQPRGHFAWLYKLYTLLVFDLLLHVFLITVSRYAIRPRASKLFLRSIAPWFVITNWRVVDRSDELLVMNHEWFRHIEIEIFVTKSRLSDSLTYIESLLKAFGGNTEAFTKQHRSLLRDSGHWDAILEASGGYTHAYPICVRRVLPDQTLISMATDSNEPVYAISFISYAKPAKRQPFLKFAEILFRTMVDLFEARPHWGKLCPLSPNDVKRLYHRLPEFRRVVEKYDRTHQFRNDWLEATLFYEADASNPIDQLRRNDRD